MFNVRMLWENDMKYELDYGTDGDAPIMGDLMAAMDTKRIDAAGDIAALEELIRDGAKYAIIERELRMLCEKYLS